MIRPAAASIRVLAIWLAGLMLCALVISRTPLSTDMSAFLPRSPSPAQQILVEQLREGIVSRLMLVAIENAPPETLAALSRGLAGRLRGARVFTLVNNGEDAGFERDRDFLWRNRYALSPAVTPESFTVAGLRAALERDLGLLGSGMSALIKRSLPADPTGEILALVDLMTGDSRPALRDGVWVSPDGARALLLLQTGAAGFDIDGQEQALTELDTAFAATRQAIDGAGGATLLRSGPGIFAVHARASMKSDAERFSIIATLLVAGLLLLAYRAPRMLALAFLPVASGALAGIAAVGLGFGFVHGITLGFGVTLIGEAVDYAIYLFTRTGPGGDAAATLPRIWPTLRLGVLTSICGFSAMLFSGFTGFAQLGLFSIVGLLVAVAVTRWILPVLLPRGFTTPESRWLGRWLEAVTRRARRLRPPLLAVLAGTAILLSFHSGSFWEADIASLSPIPAAEQALDRQLRRDLGTAEARYILMLTASDRQTALEGAEAAGREMAPLIRDGVVAGMDSPARYLPSEAAQRARQAALPGPVPLGTALRAAMDGLPFRQDLFAPFLSAVATARAQPPLTRRDLDGTALSLKLDALLLNRKDDWLALLPLRGVSDPARLDAGIAALGHPGLTLIDLKGESDLLLQSYQHEAVLLAVIGSALILVLLAVGLRSARRVALVVAPLAAAVLVTAAVLTLGTQRLSIFNLVGLLLAVAAGSNYSLFLERPDPDPVERARLFTSLVLANLCTVIGFGVLGLSAAPVLHGIGTSVALGAFLSLVFAAVLTVPGGQPRAGSG